MEDMVIRTPEDVLDLILNAGIIEVPPYSSERQGDSLYIPKLDLLLTPSVSELTENSVVIEFNMYIKKYDKHLYECSVGMGQNTNAAVGMSLASFLFSFIAALDTMFDKNDPRKITTEFESNKLNWDVYLGNAVSMGESNGDEDDSNNAVYWDLLEEDIKSRLGSQKMAYVKIFASKYLEDITTEVRIDDVAIPELSEKIRPLVENWNVEQYCSEKQFFFIEQEA